MIVARLSGIVLMVVMAQFPGLWGVKWAILPIYCIRCGLANSTKPLSQSLLMDYVPKKLRARWNSVEAVGNFGW